MKSPLHRLWALLLSLALLPLAACSAKPQVAPVAMGRYVETALTLPADFALISALRSTGDGILELMGYPDSPTEHQLSLHCYRSLDSGKTWEEYVPAWLDAFNRDYGCEYMAWAPDGTLWLVLEHPNSETYTQSMARVEDDRLVLLDWTPPNASDGSGMRDFSVAENGDIIFDCWTEFLQVDPATGSTKHIYTAPVNDSGSMNDGWAVSGNTLALSEATRIVRYDLATGKEQSATACQGISQNSWDSSNLYRLMTFGTDGSLYFADPTGLYRMVEGNDTQERLADGSLTSLSTPSVNMQQLVVSQAQYFVLVFANDSWGILSYEYDPNTPTLPDNELTVWSLTDDPLIAQTIGAFQKYNSSVHVTHTVGVPADSAVTREDAIRALNTQLVAGNAPDVLVLDGLPYSSYVEKGVLADLSGSLEPLIASGELLANIAAAYRQTDGKVYAVPAQFAVPMLHGSSDAMDAIQDLTSMADWLEANRSSFRTPFLFDSSANIMSALYPACAATLLNSEGGVSPEKLTDFLTQIRRITDLRTDPAAAEVDNDYAPDFNFGPLGWLAGYNGLNLGNLVHFPGLYAAWTASDTRGDGRTDTLFGKKTFLPVTSLAVSAQSRQPELAWQFLATALSSEVQQQAVGKGMPVSTAAFEQSSLNPNTRSDGSYSHYGTTFYDADGASTPVNMLVMYPPEEYRQQMAALLKSLDTPLFYDDTVLQLIAHGSKDYFNGTADLTATVAAIMQKLALYEAE